VNRCIVLGLLVALTRVAPAAPVRSFDDIAFWVGEGANRAALAVDWDGATATDEALVWGYRWSGDVTAERMFRDVVAADPRLFAKVGPIGQGLGRAVFGVGYDANDDGAFALDDGTTFDSDGLFESEPADDAAAVDSGDRYREGWFFGYWHYGVGRLSGESVEWSSSPVGASQRVLADGDWESYAFAVSLDFDEFAANLTAASPASEAAPGDFNSDGVVDAADYTVWRDGLTDLPGAEGYALWAANYQSNPTALAVPEPRCAVIAAVLVFVSRLCLRSAS